MGIYIVRGRPDILKFRETDEGSGATVGITVNTVGVMGKGLALQFKNKYPLNFERYKKHCELGTISVGNPILIDRSRFLLFPTKQHWRNKSHLKWIDDGLRQVRMKDGLINTLALPALGCANGGLDFNDVLPLIEKHLHDASYPVYVFPPQ